MDESPSLKLSSDSGWISGIPSLEELREFTSALEWLNKQDHEHAEWLMELIRRLRENLGSAERELAQAREELNLRDDWLEARKDMDGWKKSYHQELREKKEALSDLADEKQAHEATLNRAYQQAAVIQSISNERNVTLNSEAKLVEALRFYSRRSRHVQAMGMNPLDQIKIEVQIELAEDDGKRARAALEQHSKARGAE